MQPADNVQFGDAEIQRFARFLHDFFDAELKAIRVALLARERAKLAAQDAVVRIVDVAIDDVTGAIAVFALSGEIGDGAERIQIFGFKQTQSVGFINAFACGHFLVDIGKFRCTK